MANCNIVVFLFTLAVSACVIQAVPYSPLIPPPRLITSYEPASGGSLPGGLYYVPDGSGATTNVRPYALPAGHTRTSNKRIYVSMSNGNQDTGAFLTQTQVSNKDANFSAFAEGGQCITLMNDPSQEYWTQLQARMDIAGVNAPDVQIVHFMNLFCGMGNTYTNTTLMISDFSTIFGQFLQIIKSKFQNLKNIFINDLPYHGYHPDGNHAYDQLFAYRQVMKDWNTVISQQGSIYYVQEPMIVWLADKEMYDPADAAFYPSDGSASRAEAPTNVHESPPGCGTGYPECTNETLWGELQMALKLKQAMINEGIYIEDATIGRAYGLFTGQPLASWSWSIATICPSAATRKLYIRTDPSVDLNPCTITRNGVQKSSHWTRGSVIEIDVNHAQWGDSGSISCNNVKGLIGGKILCR